MDIEKYNEYKALVEKYSKAYYRKVSDLFELEDLAQEIWVLLLELEDTSGYEGQNRATERTFLVSCIQNHLAKLISREIYSRNIMSDDYDTVAEDTVPDNSPTPEETLLGKEAYNLLSGKISHITNGQFVLDRMIEGFSIRETSKLGKSQGLKLSKSNVHKIQSKIKEEVEKLFSRK